MNYLKVALTGFSMSFINTALFTSKFGTYWWLSYEERIREDMYHNIIVKDELVMRHLQNAGFLDLEGNNINFDYVNFDYVRYNNEFFQEPNFWFNNQSFSVLTYFFLSSIFNVAISISSSVFHNEASDYLAQKVNNYFDCNISPYLVTCSLFSSVGMFIGCVQAITGEHIVNDFAKPWAYSFIISEGFFYGTAAIAASYFGEA